MTAPLVTAPGLYPDIAAETYHADPCPAPSLSNSIAKLLLGQSPRHAWFNHPRLNPRFVAENKVAYDIGTAAHAYLLEGRSIIEVIDAADYRTKAAQEARDRAYAAGKTPLLLRQWGDVQAMATAARAQLDAHEEAREAFTDGTPEVTLVWREGEIWCRCRLDWLPNGRDGAAVIFDYKSTSGSAHPDAFERTISERGYDLQAAFYSRGIRAVLGVEAQFYFICQETYGPYALSVVGVTPQVIEPAMEKVAKAIRAWDWCLKHDSWPGYSSRIAWAQPMPWQLARWEDQKVRDQMAREHGRDAEFKQLIDWYAPFTKAGT